MVKQKKKSNKKKNKQKGNRNKTLFKIISGVVVLILLGLGIFFGIKSFSSNNKLNLTNQSALGNSSSTMISPMANFSNTLPVIENKTSSTNLPSSNPIVNTLPLKKCTDNDGDGYCVETQDLPENTKGNDCLDNIFVINPGAKEICDSIDNDCDGKIDEEVNCLSENCANGVDDDGDGKVDCFDDGCGCLFGETCINAVCHSVKIPGSCLKDADCNKTSRCILGSCNECFSATFIGGLADSKRYLCAYGNSWYDCEKPSYSGSLIYFPKNLTYKCDGKIWSLKDLFCVTSHNCTDFGEKCVSNQCIDCSTDTFG